MLRTMAALLLGATLAGAGIPAAHAAGENDAQALVRDARATLARVVASKEASPTLPRLLHRARAVMICPRIYKAAFFIGGSGGHCVLMVRGPGGWQGPAFYTLGSGSIGIQIGGQESSTVLTIMSERGLNAILDRKVKLGADLSVAAGPLGGGVSAATGIARDADMYSFSQAQGLFLGGSLEGAVIAPSDDYNSSVYGGRVAPRSIATGGVQPRRLGTGLRQDLSRF